MKTMIQKTQQEIKEAIAAQDALCKDKKYPDFAPYDGICYKCHRNIYQNYDREGRDGRSLVTGCPHCNISYCE